MQQSNQPRLEIYESKAVYFDSAGNREEFPEGPPSSSSKLRLQAIRSALNGQFLEKFIDKCRNPSTPAASVPSDIAKLLRGLVDSVGSEFGRAVIGVTVLQLVVKSIAPDQSVRLHKSGGKGESFSWCDGIPMRVLDKQFITPVLRKTGLLSLNADGCFMTRSLAENYPYTKLYKAAIRGAKVEWLSLIDALESKLADPSECLHYLIGLLSNRADAFVDAADRALSHISAISGKLKSTDQTAQLLLKVCQTSSHAARLFEIAMHSLCQVISENAGYPGHLKPLSQMRSANKKHGNVGDVEILERPDSLRIVMSWDAKFGKTYLRDELEELNEKLADHDAVQIASFVTDRAPDMRPEITTRIAELEAIHQTKVELVSFADWAKGQVSLIGAKEADIARSWLLTFAECICQRRREMAPIDEPADAWVQQLLSLKI